MNNLESNNNLESMEEISLEMVNNCTEIINQEKRSTMADAFSMLENTVVIKNDDELTIDDGVEVKESIPNSLESLISKIREKKEGQRYCSLDELEATLAIHKKFNKPITIDSPHGKYEIEIPNANGMELLANDIEQIPMLINPLFHRVGLASLIGSSDTGKSSLLRHLCICVVTGRDFLGWPVQAIYKRAYYVSTEDDKTAISSLLKKQNLDYGIEPKDIEGLVYIFETDNLVARLDDELTAKPADLVIIDAFADIFDGQLYETNRVRTFLNEYSQLAQRHGCLVIFLHHTNKRSDNLEPSKHNALGSQGFEAKMRLMIELKSNTQSINKKHLCVVKGNYLSQFFKTHSFDIQFTENLTFNSLDTRTHYELLNKDSESKELINAEYNEIKDLKDMGMTHEEVGLKLGISKSTVSKRTTRYKKLKALEENNTSNSF